MATRWVRTIRETVRYYGTPTVVLLGLLLILVGALVRWGGPPDFNLPIILLGVGCSMVAAGLVAYLNPVTAELYERILAMGVSHVYPSRNEIERKNWVEWLRSADQRFVQVGISNSGWRTDTTILPALKDRLEHNVEVKLFFLDPTSSAAGIRGKEEPHRDTQREIRDTIGYFWAHRELFEEDLKARFKMYVYNATPSLGLTWTDQLMVATHYLAAFQNLTSPALFLEPPRFPHRGSNLYKVYAENVKMLETNLSTFLRDENITQFVPQDVLSGWRDKAKGGNK
jgi:hypothetical protein